MKKLLAATMAMLVLLVGVPTLEEALAQKGGRSFSSGGSRPSSSASRPSFSGGKSYSSGGSSFSGGKSYSSSRPAAPSTVPKSGSPSPSSKPSSSFSGAPSTTRPVAPVASKPLAPKFDTLAGEAQKKVESRKLYEAGKAPAPSFTPRGAPPNKPGIAIDEKDRTIRQLRSDLSHERWVNRSDRQRSFYGGYSWYSAPPIIYYHDPYSTFFWLWMIDRNRDIDNRAYWAYHHRDTMGQQRYENLLKEDARLKVRVEELEKQLAAEKVARDPAKIPAEPKTTGPDLETRALWAYHHKTTMDPKRYADLLKEDPKLGARVEELEKELTAKNVARDPTWAPPQLQKVGPDIMYSEEAVNAIVNPQSKVETPPVTSVPRPAPHPGAAWAGVIVFVLVLAFIGFMVWLVFFKKWGGS